MHRAILMSVEDEIEEAAVHIASMPSTSAPVAAEPVAPAAPAAVSAEAQEVAAVVANPGAVESMVGRSIAEVEKDMIINTLEHCLGNRTHAANILGISIRTLRNKLNQYKEAGVDVPASA